MKKSLQPRRNQKTEEFNLLFRKNPLPMWIYDAETLFFLDVNKAAVEYSGYSRREFLKMRIQDILAETVVTRRKTNMRSAQQHRRDPGEMLLRKKDGSRISVEITSQKWNLDDRKALLAVIKDASHPKIPNSADPRFSDEFASMVSTAGDATVMVDQHQRIMAFNPMAEKLFQWTASDVIGKPLGLLIPSHIQDIHKKHAENFIKLGITRRLSGHSSRLQAARADGTEFPVEIAISSTRVNGKEYYTAILRDITEQQQAEDDLRESEDRYRDLVQSSHVLICTHDLQGKILSINPWAARVTGYQEKDLIGKNVQDLLIPEQRGAFHDYIAVIRKKGFASGLMTVVIASGEKRIWEYHNSLREEGVAEPIVRGIVYDITERKATEEALKESEQRFRSLFENTTIGFYRTTPDGRILMSNPALVKMLGYNSLEDLSRRNLEENGSEARYSRLDFKERIEREGQVRGLEAEWITKQGTSIYVRESARVVRDAMGNILYYEGTVEDITDRRRAELEILESENRYHQLFDQSPICIWQEDFTELKQYMERLRAGGVADFETYFDLHPEEILHCASLVKVLDVNQTSLSIFEADRKEDLLENVGRLLGEESRSYFKRELLAIANGARSYEGETIGHTLKGRRNAFFFRWTEIPSGSKSESKVLISFVDISDRKQAEESLRFSETLYHSLFDNVLDGIFRTTPDGKILSVNPALVRMLGYQTEEQLLSFNIRDLYVHPEIREHKLAQLNESGEIRDRELELIRADGTILVVLENSRAVHDSKGEFLFYEGTLTDITERKRAEEALRASEAELKALLDAIPDVILVLDKYGRYLKIAPTDPNLLYMPAEDLLGKRLHDIFSRQKADEFVNYIQQALQTQRPVRFEYAMLIRENIVWFSGATAPLTENSVVWVARDITPQKEAEQQVQRRLDELEALYESGLALSQTLDPKEIGRKIIQILSDRLNWHHAAVRLRRADSDEVELLAFSQGHHQSEKKQGDYAIANRAISHLDEGISGWVIRNGRVVNSGDLEKDPRYHATFPGMRSGLYVPIWSGGRVLGCISVESDQREVFLDADERFLTTLASQAAAALENARLFEAERQRRLDAETLRQAAAILTSSLNREQILDSLLGGLAQIIPFSSASVFIAEGDFITAVAEGGTLASGKLIGRSFPLQDSMQKYVLEKRGPLILADAQADPRFHQWNNKSTVRSWMGVPLMVREEVIGYLAMGSTKPNVFNESDAEMVLAFASQAAAAIENSRLYKDALLATERRSILHEVSQELSRLGQDLEQVYTSIHRSASRLMPAEAFTIALWDEESGDIEGVYLFDRIGRSPSIRMPFGQGFSSRVITSGQTILIPDDFETDVHAVHFGSEERVRSILAVPMRVGGKITGVISAQSYEPNIYNDEDRILLEMLASQAAVAIENARLYGQVNQRIKQLESLNRAGQVLTGTLELRPLLENILQAASQAILGAEKGTILLKENGHDHLHVRAQIGYEDVRLTELPFDDSKGYAGRAFHEKRPLLIRDSTIEFELPFDRQVQEVNAVQSAIVAPLIVRNEVIGAIALDNISRKNAFTEEDLNLLTIFASSAAQVIENSRLFEQTQHRANEFEALYETAAELALQTDLPTLLNSVIERAWTLSGAAGAGLYLYDQERGDLELVAIHDSEIRPGVRIALGEGLSGRVALTKKPLIVNDYQTWEHRSPKYEGVSHTSVIAVPMLYSGELIGVLDIFHSAGSDRNEPSPGFNEQDANLVYLFANAVAGAVYSARLMDQTRRRLNELDALSRVSSALRIASSRAEMAPIILNQLREILHADGAIFITANPATNELVDELAQGSLEFFTGLVIPSGQGVTAQVIQSRQLYTTSNLQDDPHVYAKERMPDVRSAVIVPLVSQDSSLGALLVARDEKDGIQPPPFAENEIRLLVAIADMAANAIQRARLHEETVAYNEQLIVVNRLGRTLAETLDLPIVYQRLAQFALDLLPDTAMLHIAEFDDYRQSIRTVHAVQEGEILNVAQIAERPLPKDGPLSEVIRTGEPMIVNDLSSFLVDPPAEPALTGKSNRPAESVLYVPMVSEGKVIGVLQAQSYSKNRYTSSDAKLLSLVGNIAAVAIQNSRLFSQLKQRVDQLSALHAIDTAINSTTDLRLSLQAVLENVTRQLRVDAACILLLNPSTLILQYVAGVGFFTLEATGTSLALGSDIAGQAALERRKVNIPDLTTDGTGVANHRLILAEKFVGYGVVPLVAKGEVKGVMELFHRSRLELDDERMSFLDMLASQAALAIDNALLFENLEKANIELTMAYDATIEGWSQAHELRDQETQGHSARVLESTLQLARIVGLSDKELHDIRRGVLLHDIGKMGIPDSILHKPGPLTDEEWLIMRKHPQHAYDMLAPIAYLRSALDIPYCHHERWDGTGYPRGLKGETIPLAARVFAVVDVYDALTTNRSYRKAWSKEQTIEYIVSQSGKHFDPAIVSAFLTMVQK